MSLSVFLKHENYPKGLCKGTERIIAGADFIWVLKGDNRDPSNPENWERIFRADILKISVD